MLLKIKQWILNRKFVVDSFNVELQKAREEERIVAFKNARQDLEETNVYDVDTKAKELSTKQVNDLLSPTDLRKIVTLDKQRGIIFIGGEKAEEGRLANLKQEAEFFLQSDLWSLLYETPKELASRAMFVQGETLADLQKGKSILYTLSTQNNIVQTFKAYVNKTPQGTKP